jgi:hypothetical protein
MKYQLCAESADGVDLHETNDPINAIEWIQDSREWASTVTYTGDPFADFALMAQED